MDSIIETKRILIKPASIEDAGFYFQLWNSPEVMVNVGFPNGLGISLEKIQKKLRDQSGDEFGRLLVAVNKKSNRTIGECYLHKPENRENPKNCKIEKIASTDIKLLPQYQGKGYGTEIKIALAKYLFDHTDCDIIEATPNVDNPASIRMQEKAGGIRVGEKIFDFPENMKDSAGPVHSYVYHIHRERFFAFFGGR